MSKFITNIAMSGAFLAASVPFNACFCGKDRDSAKENQQDRIAQGVKSGQLTAGETARLENKESALNKEVKAERTLNNGKLTPAERKQVNQQQNKLSHRIYRPEARRRKSSKLMSRAWRSPSQP